MKYTRRDLFKFAGLGAAALLVPTTTFFLPPPGGWVQRLKIRRVDHGIPNSPYFKLELPRGLQFADYI